MRKTKTDGGQNVAKSRISKRSKKIALFFVAILGMVGVYSLNGLALQQCNISAPSSTTTRLITMSLSGCTDTSYFAVSEYPDFGKNEGPEVKITNVAADDSYADVSITYPSGTNTQAPTPFSFGGAPRDIKVLTVLFVFDDDTGNAANMAPYFTPKWANRMVYGDSTTVGPDGYFKNKSFKDYVFQSTYGRMNLTGEVYPTIIHLPLEKYRNLREDNTTVAYDADLLRLIQSQSPSYLSSKKFDMLLALSSDVYSVDRTNYQHTLSDVANGNFPSIKHSLTYGLLPVDENSSILAGSITETRTATNNQTVVTRYNPRTVKGVWLESDAGRTGKNYYTGGSLNTSSNTRFTKIVLGSALPSPSSRVVVEYEAAVASKEDKLGKDWVLESSWYPHLTHEFMHDFSDTPKYSYSERTHLGDLYQPPAKVDAFDLMDSGNEYAPHPSYSPQMYYEPSLLSAPNKTMFGHVQPYTVPYDRLSTTARIYRSEFGNASSAARTSIIKIPLVAPGDLGLSMRLNNSGPKQYKGPEYLLLEWRSKRDTLEDNMHNFDRNLTSSGLVIYHVIEAEPYELTGHGRDLIRVVDATPPVESFSESYSDTSSSPATFGPQSGVMTYRAGDYWQNKTPAADSVSFEHLLSNGTGQKTLYVKFADSDGNVGAVKQVTINLTKTEAVGERDPELVLDIPTGTTINTTKNITATYSAPNGVKNIRFYVDGEEKMERSESVVSQTSEKFFFRASDYTQGPHQLKVVLYDGALNRIEKTVGVTVGTGGDNSAPSVSITSPLSGAIVENNVEVQASVTDNNSVEKVEYYIDGDIHATDTSSPYSFTWETNGLANGSHIIKVIGYDTAGNNAVAQRTVVVNNADITPPTTPSNLNGDLSSTDVRLLWDASSDTEGAVSYDVYRNDRKIGSAIAAEYNDSGLDTAASYTYYVIAKDDAGNQSQRSDSIVLHTAPLQPSGLEIANVTSSQVSLTWKASLDSGKGISYVVYRDGNRLTNTAETNLVDKTVSSNTLYRYFIKAKSSAGVLSAQTDLIEVTTKQAASYGKINGHITRGNGKKLFGAKVQIKGNGVTKTSRSNKSGWYVLKNVPTGKYTATINKPGYKTKKISIIVYKDKTTTKNIKLYPKK